MSFEPEVKPLSYQARSRFFLFVLVLFVVVVPFLIFYAIGFRFNFSNEESNITRVGGMFVSSELDGVTMYIDDVVVTDLRLFQSAAYIQNLTEGMHKIVVQADGANVWVKELPVFPHIVTEVQSFNLPATSTVRVVPRYLRNGVASVTNETYTYFTEQGVLVQNATTSTSTLVTRTENPEWDYLIKLFTASSTALNAGVLAVPNSDESLVATSTRIMDDTQLFKRNDEVFVAWRGQQDKIPYYYCVRQHDATTTAVLYGDHVAAAIFKEDTSYLPGIMVMSDRLCRSEIKIDHLRQEVLAFEFFPNKTNLILMQLADGLYVVEVDDRSWQNVQKLYAGDAFTFKIAGSSIFIKENDMFFEIVTVPAVN